MKKLIIAPDKFKGSLTGLAFCNAVEKGIRKHTTNVNIVKLPLADGGDGTIEVLNYYLEGEMISLKVNNPLFKPVTASYLYSESKKTAYIEMAEASGIRLLNQHQLNPLETTTYGTGELILDALKKGALHIILGIGGSATNDAGMGMARALGYQFYDKYRQILNGCGKDLEKLVSIENSNIHPQLKHVKFDVACDVNNTLFGANGAAYVYAPQKGAMPKMIQQLDDGLMNFNEVAKANFNINLQSIYGSGAAGGLGAGCILFLQAKLNSGIELIKKEARFDEQIKDADWIITGEGKLDKQTFSGKVIQGVINSLEDQKLAIFCGVSELDKEEYQNLRIDHIRETKDFAKDTEESISNAAEYLEMAASEFALQHF